MTDINKKFKDLNNKITQITEETKIHNRIVNQYINKLDDIEYKSLKKITSLDNILTSLKDDYTKLSNQFEKNSQVIKNKKLNGSDNIINRYNNIESDLKIHKNDMVNYINSIFGKLEDSISNINERKIKERKNIETEIEELKTLSEDIINKQMKQIEKRKENTNKIIEEVKNDCLNEFKNVDKEIKDEENKRNKNLDDFKRHLKEFDDRINEEYENQKKKKEMFEENIFSIIEETCNKLSES